MDLFGHPSYLAAAAAAAAAAWTLAAWAESRRRRLLRAFAGSEALARLFPQTAAAARTRRFALRSAGLVLNLCALAGPQWGVLLVATRSFGTQTMIAVDTSLSMLAEDLKPSRMERAHFALAQLIDGLKGHRVGLIAFAGEAFIQCPLTTDAEAAKSFLRRLRAGMLPAPGSNLGGAIALADKTLARFPGHKALVLLTDGEQTAGDALDAARAAAKNGVRLYLVGMGTPDGEPIPVKDEQGRTTAYKKDETGQTVISRLDEKGLVELAQASGGAYYRASAGEEEIAAIVAQINALEGSGAESAAGAQRYRNRYRLPLAAAFLLLLVELLLGEARPKARAPNGEAPSRAASALGLSALALLSGCGLRSDLNIFRGNAKYRVADYGEALKRYQGADPADPKAPFNAAAALYEMGDHEGAREGFAGVAAATGTPAGMRPKAHYNQGNAHFRKEEFAQAAEAYKRCLLLDPTDEDCRHNLVLALRPPQDQSPKQDKSGGQNKTQDDKKPDKPRGQPPEGGGRGQGMSKEDAERILRAIKEKEQAAAQQQSLQHNPSGERPKGIGKDW